MYKNNYGGLFVVFDGPNGAGKSTLIKGVEKVLLDRGIEVYITTEPSTTEVGNFTRKISETIDSASLACLVAADRYHHIENEIKPQLMKKQVVISDRYLLSSLILQRMDGIDTEFILAINSKILLPNIQIAVTADEQIIASRLEKRNERTRFEQDGCVAQELKFLKSGVDILRNLGVRVERVDNTRSLDKNIEYLVCCILEAV